MIRKDHKVSNAEKQNAKDIAQALNGGDRSKLKVLRISEFEKTPEEPEICIDTLICRDCPSDGISTYVTLNSSIDEEPSEADVDHRIELVGAANSNFDDFPYIFTGIAQLAWFNQWQLKEGDIIQNVFFGLKPTKMSHALVLRPSKWPKLMEGFVVDGVDVEFWWVIPIYESERQLASNVGNKKIITKLLESEIDVFNLTRKPMPGA